MFTNRTAWFSNSVRRGSRWFWVSEGGGITSWETADYLFSEDATCPDTERIFESVDYAENRLTVFHSFYLAACEKCHSVKSVCIGHYVLPPVSVQEDDRLALGNRQKEEDYSGGCCDHTDINSCHEVPFLDTPDTPQREGALCCGVQHYPVNNMVTGYVSIDELRTYSGELQDFLPGHCGSSVSKKRRSTVDIA
ncbi:telomere repeats-binding bouquet formation protein 2 [Salvelinus namaycush]|uniref:Telomere repeats-binding bouquet formation protein 2 n=1 Tax=Salvelinus namaycush TaxID=8040 RepID=A0A8U0UIR3_SALNM|nr:telomere repeats-binding bouquet formation protein 2 [Salvelinus namaycush]